jgi:hypothetical protein
LLMLWENGSSLLANGIARNSPMIFSVSRDMEI